ncbi:lipopolysaccharide biosynthesis protein [Campylobacter sp. RM12654]|uniref:glycosyl transferase family 90 n=1 Tax=Campylobacter sp. RM12654 TaxID=2735738 RepID=UPI003014C902|nr:lipopolysaccharide biosynthesis protein [Campylobacter sp. RM12654]
MSRMIMNLKGLGALSIPRVFFNMQLISKLNALKKLKNDEILHIKNRLNYYNKINDFFELKKIENVEHSKLGENLLKNTSYSFDFYKVSKYFHKDLKINKFFYDCSSEFLNTITKSRPIDSKNVILKLDSRRHFCFLDDKNDFKDKVDLAVFRGACVQQNRIDFMNKFQDCDRLNLGNVNKKNRSGYLSKEEQLKYKFIISLEGWDVATNLKWIMSSNSIAITPRLKYETWFMEGKLIPNEHFLLIQDDFSDILDVMDNALTNDKLVKNIIKNQNEYIQQFLNPNIEELLGILVLAKYFYYSNQVKLDNFVIELFD